MRTAILLIAHGSRRAEANRDLVHVQRELQARCPDDVVEIAYLELATPTIPEGARRCVDAGVSEVRMLPYFLSAGAHVARDLAQFRREFVVEWPDVTFRLCPPLGLHPLMVEVLLDRLKEEVPVTT
ncbi:CbiX/SirB N-terminal domain-containing protein [Maioricimonas sp. JC845]|uniref:sirohydrochlorin chelatase n=1 Tax=Maioricimonas sp. JC845 TaxID=3232138 RepID=UPI0034594D4F